MGRFGNYESALDQIQREQTARLDARLEALEGLAAEDERARESSPWARLAKLEAKLEASESRSRRPTGSKTEARTTVERNGAGRVSEVIGADRQAVEAFAAKLKAADAAAIARKGKLEVRSQAGGPVVSGYAAIWRSLSAILHEDGLKFREQIAENAFAQSLARHDPVVLLVEHRDLPLASTKSGTLDLREDSKGLRFQSRLDPSDPDVARIVPKVRRKDMCKCSFSFVVEKDTWDIRQSPILRTVQTGELRDVSIVSRPAYDQTSVSVTGA